MAKKTKGALDLTSTLATLVAAEERLAAIVKEAPERAVTFRDHADAVAMPTRSVVDRLTQDLREDDLRVVRSVGHLFDGRFTPARVALEAVCLMRRTAEATLNGEEVRATEQTEWLEVSGEIRHPDNLVRLGTAFGGARDMKHGEYVVLNPALKSRLPSPETMLAFCDMIPARLPWKVDVERYVGDIYTGNPVKTGGFRWMMQRLVAHVCWLEDENAKRFAAALAQAEAKNGPKLIELRKQAERLGIQVTEVLTQNLRTVRDWEAAVEARQAEVNAGKAARAKTQTSSPQPKPAPVAPKALTLAERLGVKAPTPAQAVQAAAATAEIDEPLVVSRQKMADVLRRKLEKLCEQLTERNAGGDGDFVNKKRTAFANAVKQRGSDDALKAIVDSCERRLTGTAGTTTSTKTSSAPMKGLASLAAFMPATHQSAPAPDAN